MAREEKTIVTRQVVVETTFYDFESISIIDSGSDGFRVKGSDQGADKASQNITIPNGIPYNAGKTDPDKPIKQLTIVAPASGSLNAAVSIIY